MLTVGPVGMTAATGARAAEACAAIRAGIASFRELPYKDRQRRPVIGAAVPGLAFSIGRNERLVAMLCAAIEDCVASLPDVQLERVPVLVGLAEPQRPGTTAPQGVAFIAELERSSGLRFHAEHSRVACLGNPAGMALLHAAYRLLAENDLPGCLVCGVDSFLHASTLFWLEQTWRLKREDYSNGLIPGEAAAAVFVRRSERTVGESHPIVKGLGFGLEEATVLSDQPQLGMGLTAAVRQALGQAALEMHDIDFRLSDVNGEAYGFKEQALVVARLHRAWKPEVPHWHCADSIGETGAAAGVCQLVIAHQAFARGYAFGPRALCLAGGSTSHRAAAVLVQGDA
jgi:3-oxoacyl-[acyl-carrier-protein] synthase-1